MELNGVSAPTPVQSGPIVQTEATGGEEGGGGANGAVSKLNDGGHFKGVANVRLRISHFDNADLEKIDPALLPDPEDVPGKAYEKFLAQYQELYNASLPVTEPEGAVVETDSAPEEPFVEIPAEDPVPVIVEEPVVETDSVPDEPVVEIPAEDPAPVIIEEPVVETLPVLEEPAVETPAEDPVPVIIEDPVIVTPLEIDLVAAPEQTEPEVPVDEGDGALAAFEELLEIQALEGEPETLDVVM